MMIGPLIELLLTENISQMLHIYDVSNMLTVLTSTISASPSFTDSKLKNCA